VGLPDGQMGNSEVGHLNIGAGRIVYQELMRINIAIRNGELAENEKLLAVFDYCKTNNKPLHLIGLVSDGGVHSHIEHVKALCDIAKTNGMDNNAVHVHAFTDGRDCDPKSGLGFLKDLDAHLQKSAGSIASVVGRYYAMDRDNRWERIKLAYDLLTKGEGRQADDIFKAVEESYNEGITDEFIKPIVSAKNFKAIQEGDAVICFNFRTDRCREITKALTQQDLPEQDMKKLDLHYTTMTVYDHSFKNVHNIFDNADLTMTLGEVLSKLGKTQVRVSETEKYPHVTFFFSGGREKEFPGEKRIMIASPKVATYDLQPEMSAIPVTDAICKEIDTNKPDFVCLNFANADMVGHTGVFSAGVKAVETVDACVQRVVETGLKYDYAFLITADHGNADYMINDDGSPNTAHTKNPVPIFLVDKELHPAMHQGILGDIAPTVLKIMGIEQPKEMTGKSLY
ncbi:MAG TPA: 2,3-bisphosphoglycerate-independent phosphoglycerate mutase, partial [Chitinophagales bacterium]|nr:2,3-bisphosphoglycerate-independent phosphoglycerate mutase [Chitinophagales bacterium]